jgi:putative tryptophan/tyrosine transport system substrate-binding protein
MALLAGAAAWPLTARAQQAERVRRIGVLMNFGADDAEGQVRLAAFLQGLQETGWAVGRNVRIDLRWGAANNELYREYAAELVALAPDVILASATPSVQALQHANRTVPVVFATVGDPVGMGVVASLARPGGNQGQSGQAQFCLLRPRLGRASRRRAVQGRGQDRHRPRALQERWPRAPGRLKAA